MLHLRWDGLGFVDRRVLVVRQSSSTGNIGCYVDCHVQNKPVTYISSLTQYKRTMHV